MNLNPSADWPTVAIGSISSGDWDNALCVCKLMVKMLDFMENIDKISDWRQHIQVSVNDNGSRTVKLIPRTMYGARIIQEWQDIETARTIMEP